MFASVFCVFPVPLADFTGTQAQRHGEISGDIDEIHGRVLHFPVRGGLYSESRHIPVFHGGGDEESALSTETGEVPREVLWHGGEETDFPAPALEKSLGGEEKECGTAFQDGRGEFGGFRIWSGVIASASAFKEVSVPGTEFEGGLSRGRSVPRFRSRR